MLTSTITIDRRTRCSWALIRLRHQVLTGSSISLAPVVTDLRRVHHPWAEHTSRPCFRWTCGAAQANKNRPIWSPRTGRWWSCTQPEWTRMLSKLIKKSPGSRKSTVPTGFSNLLGFPEGNYSVNLLGCEHTRWVEASQRETDLADRLTATTVDLSK